MCRACINRDEAVTIKKNKKQQPHEGGNNKPTTARNTKPTILESIRRCRLEGGVAFHSEASKKGNDIRRCHQRRKENQGFSTKFLKGGEQHDNASNEGLATKSVTIVGLSQRAKQGLLQITRNTQAQTSHIVDDQSKPPPARDCYSVGKVTGMCDLLPPCQPTTVACILHGTGHRG